MYVITGATGHTGQVIAKTLLRNGKQVRVIGRNAARLQSLVAEGAEAFVADVLDQSALTQAFTGAEAVYAMLPPDPTSPDYRAYQEHVSDALAGAVAATGVKYAVTLSSIGADKPEGTGPVAGLYGLERKLNRISGLNVLHIRPAYFMENTLGQAGAIQQMGSTAGPLRPDLRLPMIAVRDVGAAAAEALLRLNFTGQQTRELQGQRDVTMSEVASIIGQAVGKPDLGYQQISSEQVIGALMRLGMSASIAGLVVEMAEALNSGHMRALEPRTQQNTTPTSYEVFVAEEFVPVHQGKGKAA